MEKMRKIFCLSAGKTFIIVIPVFCLTVFALTKEINPFLADLIYLASTYALILIITLTVRSFPRIKEFVRELKIWNWIRRFRIGRLFLDDLVFRTKVGLYFGVVINSIYVIVKLINGIMFQSDWLIVMAVYYLILAVMRYSLIDYEKKTGIHMSLRGEWKRYRFCGMVLLIMNLVLVIMVVLSIYHNEKFEYPGMLIYAMAFYSFYAVIYAVSSLISTRRYRSPLLSAVKVITLTAAMVSMLSLEIAMTARFGEDAVEFRQMMTSLTGGVVCMAVMGMAWYMILHSTGELKKDTDILPID